MDNQTLQILLDISRENSKHIEILNREMGEVVSEIAIIKWFIGANVIAWIGVITSAIWQIIIRK